MKLGSSSLSKMDGRWICAQERCKRTGNWKLIGLDDALEHFCLEPRDENENHDALKDARLAAQVYMAASLLPSLKSSLLGFINEEEE